MKKLSLLFCLILPVLIPRAGHCFYNPSEGRWLSRDPIQENGGPDLQAFVGNNAANLVDPVGLRIFVMTPPGALDGTQFAETVLAAFQSIIGDCAQLHMKPVFQNVERGYLWWSKSVSRVVAQEIYATDIKASCACNPCWKDLRSALADNLPKRDIEISRETGDFYLGNAVTLYGDDG